MKLGPKIFVPNLIDFYIEYGIFLFGCYDVIYHITFIIHQQISTTNVPDNINPLQHLLSYLLPAYPGIR